jgi:pseudouridine-5'-phosphate glycosidase
LRYTTSMNQSIKDLMQVSQEVGQALLEKRPVVALESTVIAQGLPQPMNIEVAAGMENIIRKRGATPATIAILDGKICYGLSERELERVGTAANITKASQRDLPLLMARRGNGATTVSATSFLAALIGIKVFATGGIGGVHRGWERTMDISTDLPTLANTSIVVVCAGAKSVLDVSATLEWLETNGVPVIGYRTDRFPGFYTPVTEPGLPVDVRVETAKEVADIYDMRRRLGMRGSVLVSVPIPSHAALTHGEVDRAIGSALHAAEQKRVRGRDLTPFLLEALSSITGGRSLLANRTLLENNAAVAADISKAVTPVEFV